MSGDPQSRFRRITATVCIVIAALMVVLGLTVFGGAFQARAYLLYWLCCLFSTLLAMIFAFWDLKSIRRQGRQQKREVFTEAFRNIEAEVANGKSRSKH